MVGLVLAHMAMGLALGANTLEAAMTPADRLEDWDRRRAAWAFKYGWWPSDAQVPEIEVAMTHADVQALIEKFKDMERTSERAMRRAQKRGEHMDAAARKAEACTLNVVLFELDVLLHGAGGLPGEEKKDDLARVSGQPDSKASVPHRVTE